MGPFEKPVSMKELLMCVCVCTKLKGTVMQLLIEEQKREGVGDLPEYVGKESSQ